MKRFTQCKVVWTSPVDPIQRRRMVELAHLAGFYSVNMQFPAAVSPDNAADDRVLYLWPDAPLRRDNILSVRLDGDFPSQWSALFERLSTCGPFEQTGTPPHGYHAADGHGRPPVCPLSDGGLEDLFSPGCLLCDNDGDGLADEVRGRLLLPDNACESQYLAACDFAARLGMETTGLAFPLTLAADDGASPLIQFCAADEPAVVLNARAPRRLITVEGCGEVLTAFSARFCSRFPWAADHLTLADAARQLEQAVRMDSFDGQAAVLSTLQEPAQAFLSADAPLDRLRPFFPQAELRRHTDFIPVFCRQFSAAWELDDARTALTDALTRIPPGSHVRLHGLVSEDAALRHELADWFRAQALQHGARSVDAEVLCAYKPGLSWLEESFAPRAAACGNVARAEIFFNPHMRPGAPVVRESGSPWNDVDELIDKPPRWLQELYPVDELIAPLLGISKENIVFEAYAGPEDITYEARAYDAGGRCLLCDTFKVSVSEQPYLPYFAEQGVCAPTTGRLLVEADGQRLLDCRIATDGERLWNFYQSDVLPAVADFVTGRAKNGSAPVLPLFGRLELDIGISEPERPLPMRSDLISSGEVLSEDLFDAGKAFLHALCQQTWGIRPDAVGHILPRVHLRPGPPSMTAALYDHLSPAPRITFGTTCIEPAKDPVAAMVARVSDSPSGLVPHFSVCCPEALASRLEPIARMIEQGVAAVGHTLAPYAGLVITAGNHRLSVALPPTQPPVQDLRIEDIDLMPDRLIDYDAWQRMAEQLMRVPGLDVYPAGTTFYGRTVYALELACSLPGYVSTVKRLQRGPSLLIGGRHHANELSASNALSRLIGALASDPELRALSDRLMLTVIPMENADGAALHASLYREHPGWVHHSCYTPPLGRDLYAMYFQNGAANADGQAFSRLYRRVLPDAFIDIHGVPSHDWQHQFASLRGYKGLWVPRALLCGFYWYCSDPEYTDNFRLNRAWAEAVGEAYFAYPGLQQQSAELRERFDKYSYNGINLDFPAAFENRMLNYWIPNRYHPRHPYLSVRFPWITSVSFTSEAADEGACGQWLENCAAAQLVHVLAGIRTCLSAGRLYLHTANPVDGGIRVELRRMRPLLPPGGATLRTEEHHA